MLVGFGVGQLYGGNNDGLRRVELHMEPDRTHPYRGVSEGPLSEPRSEPRFVSPRERMLAETVIDWRAHRGLKDVAANPSPWTYAGPNPTRYDCDYHHRYSPLEERPVYGKVAFTLVIGFAVSVAGAFAWVWVQSLEAPLLSRFLYSVTAACVLYLGARFLRSRKGSDFVGAGDPADAESARPDRDADDVEPNSHHIPEIALDEPRRGGTNHMPLLRNTHRLER